MKWELKHYCAELEFLGSHVSLSFTYYLRLFGERVLFLNLSALHMLWSNPYNKWSVTGLKITRPEESLRCSK